ncbi:MAG: UDP-N-acetylmuramate dehydrogenase [Candidatus Pacebacteria bacterium]|nr:UDP-N-acetylmuramate dehydrogenase [Candidatus Paceibacterota bacterium]
MSDALFQSVSRAFPNLQFFSEESLVHHTYMKSGGCAEVFVSVKNSNDLEKLSMWCIKQNVPLTILGGASNVLVPDEGLRGLVIKNVSTTIQVRHDKEFSVIIADSGVPTNLLVRRAINEELEGLEYFLGVPGSVGGAVYNNSHYMNQLIGEHVTEVEIVEKKTGKKKSVVHSQIHFAYDYSLFHETHDVILRVHFTLKKGKKDELERRAKEATVKRATTQPLGIPSSGCMFKNGIFADGSIAHAGKLIDLAGLKGFRIGDAVVSDKHANFILNLGGATTHEILAVAKHVQDVVQQKYGVELDREVFLLKD